MITVQQYYMGRDVEYKSELTEQLRKNAELTVALANKLLIHALNNGVYPVLNANKSFVRSGWRPPAVNRDTPNAAPRSNHMTCEAIDIEDNDGDLDEWCLNHLSVLEDIGLWMEHPAATKSWCHLQTKAPRSGRRVFNP